MVGWDEIFNPALPKDVVVQSWRAARPPSPKAHSRGYQGVLSAPYYLDAMKPASVMYLADPVPANTTLTPDQQKLILGGEITMWAEQLDARSIDSRIWPRSAAIAERFWSAQSRTDVDDLYRRLDPVSLELEALGLHQVSAEGVALRDLAGPAHASPGDRAAFQTFAQAFEPVGFSDRYQQQHTSQLTPLTSLVDAVRPDPPIRHGLELAAKTLIAHPESHTPLDATPSATDIARLTLIEFFQSVSSSLPQVRSLVAASPRLQPLQPRVDQLPALTLAGIEATNYLSSKNPAPERLESQKPRPHRGGQSRPPPSSASPSSSPSPTSSTPPPEAK